MADYSVHPPSIASLITATKGIACPNPLDASAKAQLITDVTSASQTQLTNDGFTEASGSLVVTIDGDDVMWFDYDHDSETYRALSPLEPGNLMIVGKFL